MYALRRRRRSSRKIKEQLSPVQVRRAGCDFRTVAYSLPTPKTAARRSQRRLECRCRQRSGGCRGSAWETTWCRATLGEHAARKQVCVSCPTSFEWSVSCSFFSGSNDKIRTEQAVPPGVLHIDVAAAWRSEEASLRALLTRVYHRTWTGSRWMFENMGLVP